MEPHLLDIELHRDPRGALICLDSEARAPFPITRVFFIFDVPAGQSRGGHATRCQELLIALRGSCRIVTEQGRTTREFLLSAPTQALYVPQGVWLKLDCFAPESLLAVAADRPYVAG